MSNPTFTYSRTRIDTRISEEAENRTQGHGGNGGNLDPLALSLQSSKLTDDLHRDVRGITRGLCTTILTDSQS